MRARTPTAGLAAAAATAVWMGVLTPRRLRVRDVPLSLTGWPEAFHGLRVAVVGDVHAGAPFMTLDRVRAVCRQVVAARPDLIVLLGDHLADVWLGRHLEPEPVAAAFAELLLAQVPVVGVLGNHDWYAGGERVRSAFEDAGLPVLEESALEVLPGLWVAGVGDLWERSPDPLAALSEVPDGAATILLTHNPDVVLEVPRHVPLVLAGHTHGGQVRILKWGVHRVSRQTGNRFSPAGFYPAERLYVSPGVGTSTAPLRTVVPEIPVLVLGSS